MHVWVDVKGENIYKRTKKQRKKRKEKISSTEIVASTVDPSTLTGRMLIIPLIDTFMLLCPAQVPLVGESDCMD
jgi:hypothetical protein